MERPSANTEFCRIYEAHHAQVLGYMLRRIDQNRAQDAAAEVFVAVWRRIGDVPQGEETLPWLYGVAHRVLLNQRRAAGRFTRLVERAVATHDRSGSPQTPERVVVRNAEHEMVLGALQRLRLRDRELIRLNVWEELSHERIGAVLGCSSKAVSMRLHRALKRLQHELRSVGINSQGTLEPRPVPEGGNP